MKKEASVLSLFQDLLQELLTYLNVVAKGSAAAASSGESAVSKFWRALLNKIYEILDRVTGLLPSHLLLDCICSLLGHSNATIRRKSLDLLHIRLHQLLSSASEASSEQVSDVLGIVSLATTWHL